MAGLPSNINFSLQYAISIVVVLIVCNILVKTAPKMSTVIVIIVGLFVGYLTLLIMNNLFPALNSAGDNMYQYYMYQVMNNFNSMGYLHIWPPILAVLIIFIVLLYNKNLG
jgi:xanthine/uracil permease